MYFLKLGLNVLNTLLLIGVFLILSNCQLTLSLIILYFDRVLNGKHPITHRQFA